MPLNDLLQNRRSTRRFRPDAPIDRAELNALISQANRAPSSNNAQPWRIMVLTDPALRQRQLPEAYGQEQIITASAVLVLLGDRAATASRTCAASTSRSLQTAALMQTCAIS